MSCSHEVQAHRAIRSGAKVHSPVPQLEDAVTAVKDYKNSQASFVLFQLKSTNSSTVLSKDK